jgi:hypothetical protein
MKPLFLGQGAQICPDLVKLAVIGCPLDVLLEPQ